MKRIHYLDVARGIAILLVVLGHCYNENYIRTWIYSFHMPLFFIMSGMLINYKNETEINFSNFIIKKLKSNLVPYLFFSLLILISEAFIKQNLIENLVDIFLGVGLWALWFIPCLFLAEIFFLIISKNVKNRLAANLVFLFLFALGLFLKVDVENKILIVIIRSFIGLGFIVFGYNSTNIFSKIKANYLTLIISLITSLILTFSNSRVELWNLTLNNEILYVLASIIGSISVLIISKIIDKNKYLEFFGKGSLIILGTHQFLVKAFFTIGNKFIYGFDKNSILYGFIVFVFTILVEIVIILIINKYFSFILGKSNTKQKNIVKI